MKCINLKTKFGSKHRITYEDPIFKGNRDPWHLILLCQHGHIYPFGGNYLGASTDKSGPIARQLRDMECCTTVQVGSDGTNVSFHVDDFAQVAALMRPRRRRQGRPLTEAEKAASERLAIWRLKKAS